MLTADAVSQRTIRVLLADVPGLLAALIAQSIAGHKDMQVIGTIRTDALDGLALHDADVVVTCHGPRGLPAVYRDLFFSAAQVRVLAISGDGRVVEVYDRRVVREIALDQLVSVIRDAAEQRLA
jgi:hypothetical protein